MRTFLILAALTTAACSGPAGRTPTSPARAPAVAVATLTVSSFEVTRGQASDADYPYAYSPSWVLTETSGQSAATLQSIVFSIPDGQRSWAGQNCILNNPIPRNGSWQSRSVGYCLEQYSQTDLAWGQALITVSFVDDEGRPGTATGSTSVKLPKSD